MTKNAIAREDLPAKIVTPGVCFEFLTTSAREFQLISISEDALHQFGLDPAASVNARQIISLFPPAAFAALSEELFAAAQQLRPLKHEFRVPRHDGSLCWLRSECFPQTSDQQGIIWHGHLMDITAHKQTEAVLREQLELMEFCQHVAVMGYWLLDLETHRLSCSSAHAEMLGYEAGGGPRTFEDLLAHYCPASRATLRQAVAHAAATHEGWDLILSIQRQGRPDMLVRSVGAHLREGRNPHLCCVVQDVTAQQAEIESQERFARIELLGQLAGGIAHDFNNFLTSITLSLDAMKADPGLSDRARIAIRDAENAAKSSRRLTHQLLTFAKGGAPLKAVIDLRLLLHETVDFAMSGSGCRCVREIPEDLWCVHADRAQIQQVIHNLIINAREATNERGEIFVLASNFKNYDIPNLVPAALYCRISVRDNGPGIPESVRSRIFSPYFTTKPNGTGLGLATSFSIARRHEGQLTFETTHGNGTIFHLFIPAEPGRTAMETKKIGYLRRGNQRILLMDDQADILRIISAALERFGYQVTTAQDSATCVQALREAQADGATFAAAILDLTLPGGPDGIETLRLLREIEPSLPAVGCSGYAESDVMAHPERYGFQRMLPKPFRIDELVEVLQSVIRAAHLHKTEPSHT